MQIIKNVLLSDTITKKLRAFIVARCRNPQCNCLKAEFVFFDTIQNKFVYEKVRKNKIAETIKMVEEQPYLTDYNYKIKNGSKSNQYWIYGETKQCKDKIKFFAVNFNGEKREV